VPHRFILEKSKMILDFVEGFLTMPRASLGASNPEGIEGAKIPLLIQF
jgi:hypothetical protein